MAPERKLTIVQVLPALESGGVERGTLEVGKYLVERGHRSIVISAGGRMVEQLTREGSQHVHWDIGRKSLWTLGLIPRLRRFLRENQVDILHARSRMPAWICYLAWKGMDPQTRPHFVTTVHGLYSVSRYSAVMVKGERIIAVSETVRDYILANYPWVESERIEVIYRGVEPKEFPYGYSPSETWLHTWQAQYPQLAGKQVLTLPGRITRLKGHEDFIRLIATLKAEGQPVHGLIVGGAHPDKQSYLQELMQRVVEAGLENDITFTGQRSDLKDIQAVSNLALSLSTKPESFGRTTLEALRLGIPTAGYDHGGVGEILRAIYPAGLLPRDDLAGSAKRIIALLQHPQAVPNEDFFPLEDMLAKTLEFYVASLQVSPPREEDMRG